MMEDKSILREKYSSRRFGSKELTGINQIDLIITQAVAFNTTGHEILLDVILADKEEICIQH